MIKLRKISLAILILYSFNCYSSSFVRERKRQKLSSAGKENRIKNRRKKYKAFRPNKLTTDSKQYKEFKKPPSPESVLLGKFSILEQKTKYSMHLF